MQIVSHCSLIVLVTLVSLANGLQCGHGKKNKDVEAVFNWVDDSSMQNSFRATQRTPKTPDRVSVDLDLPPNQRWIEVGKQYANQSDLIIEYFETMLPKAAVVIIEKIAAHLVGYRGFGDYGEEMKGYAEGLGLDLGYVVAANLVYQLESIGVNCSNWNNTGPTGDCADDDFTPTDIVWYESEHFSRSKAGMVQTGYCTSVVAENDDGYILHGRNLDWNLEEALRSMIITVDFHRSGTPLYSASTIVSFVGILNAMKPGENGFSFSMNARCQGGKILWNLVEALATGAMTPCQHSRTVMETATDFESAVTLFGTGKIIDDGYFIVGGSKEGEGAVVSRDRNRAADVWRLDNTESDGWYRLETNYDHWEPVPSSDNRRTPGYDHMNQIGRSDLSVDNLLDDVLTVWPTLNPHTDLTCMMAAATGYYNCSVWMGE